MNRELGAALDDMRGARQQFEALVEPLGLEALGHERPGGWSVGRVLQHVIESEGVYAKLLAHLCGRTATELPAGEPVHGGEAASMLLATRAAVLAMVDGVDDDTLFRLVRIGHEEYSPLSVLQNIASHDRDHYAQIEALVAERPAAPALRLEGSALAPTIRAATIRDLPRLTEIYNHYIEHTPITFDLEPFTVEQRHDWFAHHTAGGRHQLLVADVDGAVIGYAGSGSFRAKRAYDTTVETTIYCAPEATGRGAGTRLYRALFEALDGEDIRTAIAGITLPNDASIALHERFGFTLAGVMRDVGRKFGRYWDVAWYEKRL